jgi:hypothetical protein
MPSGSRRNTTSDTPTAAAAARCSASRMAIARARVMSSSAMPTSPLVHRT